MSDRICIASGQTLQTRISTEDLLTCCGTSCGYGCDGGYISGAWNYFKTTGIVTGWLYNDKTYCQPYFLPTCDTTNTGDIRCSTTQTTPACQQSCVNGATYLQDRWFGESAYKVSSNVANIQIEIMTYGPVEAGFYVYSDFLTYKSGVYHRVSNQLLGGHAIKIIGWGVENKTPYWLAANSWSTSWGALGGFFKIKRGTN
jgi:cathepsin B